MKLDPSSAGISSFLVHGIKNAILVFLDLQRRAEQLELCCKELRGTMSPNNLKRLVEKALKEDVGRSGGSRGSRMAKGSPKEHLTNNAREVRN
jgi:hypothetical protein